MRLPVTTTCSTSVGSGVAASCACANGDGAIRPTPIELAIAALIDLARMADIACSPLWLLRPKTWRACPERMLPAHSVALGENRWRCGPVSGIRPRVVLQELLHGRDGHGTYLV